jgi:hypothetical protein
VAPSTIDILKEMQSSGNLSDKLSEFVNYYLKSLIHKEDTSKSILVNLESVVENPTNDIINTCKACQIVMLLVRNKSVVSSQNC